MKKFYLFVLLTTVLVLTGCGQKDIINYQEESATIDRSTVIIDISTYKNERLNISFKLPSTWRISTSNQIQSLTVASPPTGDTGTNIVITIPAESFAEYESVNKEMIQAGKMSISNKYLTENKSYTFKEYGQHGLLYYITEIQGKYVGVGAEQYLNPEQQEGLNIVLDSLSFY